MTVNSWVRRLVRRHRRALTGLAAATSIVALGAALQAPGSGTRSVVVAAASLPAGHHLQAGDLAVVPVPEGIVPEGAWRVPDTLVGRVLASGVTRGEAIAPARVLGGRQGLGPGHDPELRPLPTRFADAGATALLAPGQRIDVLATGDDYDRTAQPAVVVAEDVLVLLVTQEDERSGLLGSSGVAAAPLVVLATDGAQARAIAGAQGSGLLSFTFRP